MKILINLTTLIIVLFSSCTQILKDDDIILSKSFSPTIKGNYRYTTSDYNIEYETPLNLEIGDKVIKDCNYNINPRSYQIEVLSIRGQDYIGVYNSDKPIGVININNTKLDSLIIKDNQ